MRKLPFDVDQQTGCWNWTGTVNRGGYGVYKMGSHGKPNYFRTTAHRMAWVMRYGYIGDTDFVLHRCNNPKCVNVDHLYLGDHDQNMKDRMEANHYPRGEKHPTVKYTDAQVRKIMELGHLNDCQVSRLLGIRRHFVRRVRTGRTRTEITGGPLPIPRKKGQRYPSSLSKEFRQQEKERAALEQSTLQEA